MRLQLSNLFLVICVLLVLSCSEQTQTQQIVPSGAITGSISGNISPISVYDAKVEVLQEGEVITAVGVQDGVFHIKDLSPGRYNLRISAFAYVTNDAIRGIEVVEGKVTEVGRAVIFRQDTGGYVPTRIKGKVSDAVTGAPIAGVIIKVKCNEAICNTLEGTSDSEGRFEIAVWSNLTSIVIATKGGYQSSHVEVGRIPSGESASVSLKLTRLDN